MSDLVVRRQSLPATPAATLEALADVQEVLMRAPQVDICTEHVIHGGMYSRTVRLEPGTVIVGALIKVPTMLIVHGHCRVFVGDRWIEAVGYSVVPASAGRKQLFYALSPVEITMIFPTSVKSVEEAEEQFTDEAEALLSRRDGVDITTITGE